MSEKLLVYSEDITPRLEFIVSLFFKELLGLEAELTSESLNYENSTLSGVNYSATDSFRGVHILPQGLLSESNIRPLAVTKGSPIGNVPTLLLDNSKTFDPLAAGFYLVSRYEEYLSFEADAHNRFPADASCLKQLGLLRKPLVNLWALNMLDQLKALFPDIQAQPRRFEYLSTIDIDQAWKFKNKGLFRNLGGFGRDVLKGEWQEVSERIGVLFGGKTDPFYNYDWQDEVHARYQTQVQYFVQVGQNGEFDKNISVQNQAFRTLIKRLDDTHSVGIHPSYQSNTNSKIVADEHHTLRDLLGYDVKVSRQHYLMHRMPETYQNLIDIGITSDHTLGYSTDTGFRAGIAAPFYFFDLSKNEATNLLLIPFCYMDITPLHYMQLSPEEAKKDIQSLMEDVRAVGGLFVSLWHNESLSESGRWKGWRTLYEELVRL